MKLLYILLFFFPVMGAYAQFDSIGEQPLKYEVLGTDKYTQDFFLVIGDKKFNIYRQNADFIVEWKKKKELWLLKGQNFNPYPGSEMYIDSIYFQNISESSQKELNVVYSLFSLRNSGSIKTRGLLVIDLTERKVILNIATYDYRIDKDENGKVIEYLYEANVKISHNAIEVVSTDDSDIDNPAIQLDDGLYLRKGHYFKRKK